VTRKIHKEHQVKYTQVRRFIPAEE